MSAMSAAISILIYQKNTSLLIAEFLKIGFVYHADCVQGYKQALRGKDKRRGASKKESHYTFLKIDKQDFPIVKCGKL